MKLWLYAGLERLFERLGELCEKLRERFAYCPTCGKNRYASPPCVKL